MAYIESNIELLGVKTLTSDFGNTHGYYFTLPFVPNNTALQTYLSQKALEEVWINCKNFGNLEIYLPKISLFYGVWNPKIYISPGVVGRDTTISVIPFTTELPESISDKINQQHIYNFQSSSEFIYLQPVSENNWMLFKTI